MCVHSSANETGLSKKDVKRVRTEEIRHESLRVSVIFNHSRGFVWHNVKQKDQKSIFTNHFWVFDSLETSEACGNTIQTAKSAAIKVLTINLVR